MLRHTKLLAILAMAFVSMTTAARAADDPSGDWKWTFERNGQSVDILMTLKADGEKLTGTVGREDRKTEIQDGTFKDGEVSFKVVRERNGQNFTSTYKGKLEGDAIKGTMDFEFGGEARSRPWEAARVK
jgi:hypothetical protein